MKEDILKLRSEGKTYKEIVEILGCSKSVVSYHCGNNQKEKSDTRRKKRRNNVLITKLDRFKHRKHFKVSDEIKDSKSRKDVVESIRKYQKTDTNFIGRVNKNIDTTFNWENVINKFGNVTKCYLSGVELNLLENEYQLDHIIPASRGGDNTLKNLGITHKTVNQMKGDLTPDELIEWCIKILHHNDYIILK